MLNDYEIKVEIEKIKLWAYYLCIRVCRLEGLDNTNEDNKEEENKNEEDKPEPPHEEEEEDDRKFPLYGIIYGGESVAKYVTITFDWGAYYSEDGVNWTHTDFSIHIDRNPILVYGNGTYLITSYEFPFRFTSTDGINWIRKGDENPINLLDVKFDGDKFIGVSTSDIMYSYDGEYWYKYPIEDDIGFFTEHYEAIASNGNIAVAVGRGGFDFDENQRLIYTEDSINWKRLPQAVGSDSTPFIAFGNNIFVAAWKDGQVIYSKHPDVWDEVEWEDRIKLLKFTGNRFIICTDYTIKSSVNGINWIDEGYANINYLINDIAISYNTIYKFNNNKWDIVARHDYDTYGSINSLNYINGKYYICCDTLLSSTDGINWDELDIPKIIL